MGFKRPSLIELVDHLAYHSHRLGVSIAATSLLIRADGDLGTDVFKGHIAQEIGSFALFHRSEFVALVVRSQHTGFEWDRRVRMGSKSILSGNCRP